MNARDEFFDLLDAYAFDTLEAPERESVRLHLASCTSCRSELDELRNVLDLLPHALEAPAPSAASREKLLTRLNATQPAAAPPDAPQPAATQRTTEPRYRAWAGALAAALALALIGDAWFAWKLQRHEPAPVAFVHAQPPATHEPAATPPTFPKRPATTTPRKEQTPPTVASAIPIPRTANTPAPDGRLLARIALLEDELRRYRVEAGANAERAARDTARIAALTGALSRYAAPTVAARTPLPEASASASPAPAAALAAALGSGRVFGVDGVVGTEPWHLTILQPPNAANAVIYSEVPHAPLGETYRAWVLRDGKTYDAGELRAGSLAILDMPMAIQTGDVVAFSREPVDSGNEPTTAFLMQVTIK
jgi:anti-sigma factor RsiW